MMDREDLVKENKKLKSEILKLRNELAESDKIFREILDEQEEEYEMELMRLKAVSEEELYKECTRSQVAREALEQTASRAERVSRHNKELKSKISIVEDLYKQELQKRKEIQVSACGRRLVH